MNAIVTRISVADIVAYRNKAIAAYQLAFDRIEAADLALKEAASLWVLAAGNHANSRPHDKADEIGAFFNAVKLPDRAQWERTVVRLVDRSIWQHIVDRTNLQNIMDKQAREEFFASLKWVPERRFGNGELVNLDEINGIPPVTLENIDSTLEKWLAEAGMMVHRGIAEAFSSLDRRFKSHDGFKVGSRMIISRMMDDNGYWNHYTRADNTLRDVERVFLLLDGKEPRSDYAGIIGRIRHERQGWGAKQSSHHGEYFRVDIFKNGNAHLWFTRDDLVEKVNKMLAAYYGEVIGDAQQQDEDLFASAKRTPAKRFGFYPTPKDAAERVIAECRLTRSKGEPGLRILEPSAGTGNLAKLLAEPRSGWEWVNRERVTYGYMHYVDCVEIQPSLAQGLDKSGLYKRVFTGDFLDLKPETTGLYDRIVMNPPFDLERDIDHVLHACRFLAPHGRLVSIMSAGTEFRETKKAIRFRSIIEKAGGRFTELPARSFAESGTNVNTVILVLDQSERLVLK